MPGPSRRDLEREIAKVDEDEEGDRTEAWQGFIEGKHPREFSNPATADMLRNLLLRNKERSIEDFSAAEVREFDRTTLRMLRESEEFDDPPIDESDL